MSSIVGAIFMILIVGSLASAYFFFTLSQNTIYNDAVRERNQLDIARMSENVQALDSAYKVNSNNIVITAKIQNTGSSSVHLVTLWVYSSEISGTWNNYNFMKIDITLEGGQSPPPQSFDVPVQGVSSTGNYNFAAWLITDKGNTISLKSGQTNNIVYSKVSEGIGSIAMDFKQFHYYDFGTSTPSSGTPLGTPQTSFNVPNGDKSILAVLLTNLDPSGKDIILTGTSYVWIMVPQAETLKSASWKIAKVDNNQYLTPFDTQVLPWGEPTWVYFGPTSPGFAGSVTLPQVVPVFILLYGSLEGQAFGQNIPFVAFNIS